MDDRTSPHVVSPGYLTSIRVEQFFGQDLADQFHSSPRVTGAMGDFTFEVRLPRFDKKTRRPILEFIFPLLCF